MGNFIPSSRNIERFDRLMAQYFKFLTELSFLCDGDTSPELRNSIHVDAIPFFPATLR
jgi:hypothetical protein